MHRFLIKNFFLFLSLSALLLPSSAARAQDHTIALFVPRVSTVWNNIVYLAHDIALDRKVAILKMAGNSGKLVLFVQQQLPPPPPVLVTGDMDG